MFSKILKIFLIFMMVMIGSICGEMKYEIISGKNNENEINERPNTWLQSAQSAIGSPAGHVVMQVAKELLNRSAGNSQVLSLNLTNLLIIILLKVLIFSAGLLGAGHWSSYGYARSSGGRSSDGSFFGFENGEDYLITGFLAAQGAGMNDCLYAAACNSPSVAYEYARAGKALLEGLEKYEGNTLQNTRYKELIVLMEQGAYDGYRGVSCNTTAKCDALL